jgi:GDP-mannose 6-dehydrogenase
MRLVCRDTKLNISPAYLRPGFSFGGSCLPKDVRALTRYAEREAIRLPLLSAVLPSNQEHLQRAIRLIEGCGCRRLGLVGLGFKAGTDDLRESPFVALAETLIGRGYDLRIFDPVINVSRLCGRNRAYMDEHLPHLASLLVENPRELCDHASLLLIATDVADELDVTANFDGSILDLRRALIANEPASVLDEIGAAESAETT